MIWLVVNLKYIKNVPPTPPNLETYNVKNLKTAPFILYYVSIVGNFVKYLLSLVVNNVKINC